jgi:hypothetical protein
VETDDLLDFDASRATVGVNDIDGRTYPNPALRGRMHSGSKVEGTAPSQVTYNRRPSPIHSIDLTNATYGTPKLGFGRLQPEEITAHRKRVVLTFPEPPDSVVEALCQTFERIQRRAVQPAQRRYLIRCLRIHGDETERLLLGIFRIRRAENNLLLALELTPPLWDRPWDDPALLAGEAL